MKPYYSDSHVTIFHGDCREVLPHLDASSVQTCVTSPPYFGLRDYGGGAWVGGEGGCDHIMPQNGGMRNAGRDRAASGGTFHDSPIPHVIKQQYRDTCGKCGATRQDQQIGLEPTPAAYVAEMTGVFEQVRRVLRSDGTAWLNLGDSYASATKGSGGATPKQATNTGSFYTPHRINHGVKEKDLIGIPWRVAFALQEAGWWLRSDIIWSKGNPMPESVTDRPTKAHEYLFLLAKAEKYYYDADAIREPHSRDYSIEAWANKRGKQGTKENSGAMQHNGTKTWAECMPEAGRNKRSVWNINVGNFAGAHFAVFPEKLIEPCILAGCPAQVCAVCGAPWVRQVERDTRSRRDEYRAIDPTPKMANGAGVRNDYGTKSTGLGKPGWRKHEPDRVETLGFAPTCNCNADSIPGTVLDPFMGSGTTLRVAKRLGRRAIGVEQSEKYCDMAASSLLQQAFEVFA